MSKQMELTEEEQKTFKMCMVSITNILMSKKKVFSNPQITGSADVDGEDVTFLFDFRIEAKNK